MAAILRITKREALKLADTSSRITVTDRDADWDNKPVSYEEMYALLRDLGHLTWWATQTEGCAFFSIDTRSRIHFEITL